MKTILLDREKIHTGMLILVNAHYPVQYEDKNDLTFADPWFPDILIKRDAANVLNLIIDKLSAYSSIIPVSGYRSEAEQTEIYTSSEKENGKEFTKKYVALPKHSEHQTGLAIDLGLNKEDIDFICPDFPYEGICNDFRKTAYEYGFIERYQKDKEKITGISHEPWHFRYVGYPHSMLIKKNSLSLEEYIEFIKSYRSKSPFIFRDEKLSEIEIYYVPADSEKTQFSIPENSVYQISGNNTDGFIVTLWRRKYER